MIGQFNELQVSEYAREGRWLKKANKVMGKVVGVMEHDERENEVKIVTVDARGEIQC